MAAFGRPAVVIDLETTGGNADSDCITEIALLRFDGGGVTRYTRLVNPQRGIPAFGAALTGIDDNMVADAPPFAALADKLLPLWILKKWRTVQTKLTPLGCLTAVKSVMRNYARKFLLMRRS